MWPLAWREDRFGYSFSDFCVVFVLFCVIANASVFVTLRLAIADPYVHIAVYFLGVQMHTNELYTFDGDPDWPPRDTEREIETNYLGEENMYEVIEGTATEEDAMNYEDIDEVVDDQVEAGSFLTPPSSRASWVASSDENDSEESETDTLDSSNKQGVEKVNYSSEKLSDLPAAIPTKSLTTSSRNEVLDAVDSDLYAIIKKNSNLNRSIEELVDHNSRFSLDTAYGEVILSSSGSFDSSSAKLNKEKDRHYSSTSPLTDMNVASKFNKDMDTGIVLPQTDLPENLSPPVGWNDTDTEEIIEAKVTGAHNADIEAGVTGKANKISLTDPFSPQLQDDQPQNKNVVRVANNEDESSDTEIESAGNANKALRVSTIERRRNASLPRSRIASDLASIEKEEEDMLNVDVCDSRVVNLALITTDSGNHMIAETLSVQSTRHGTEDIGERASVGSVEQKSSFQSSQQINAFESVKQRTFSKDIGQETSSEDVRQRTPPDSVMARTSTENLGRRSSVETFRKRTPSGDTHCDANGNIIDGRKDNLDGNAALSNECKGLEPVSLPEHRRREIAHEGTIEASYRETHAAPSKQVSKIAINCKANCHFKGTQLRQLFYQIINHQPKCLRKSVCTNKES